MALAQHYPTAFDGIIAAAPAMYLPQIFVADYWPQLVMNTLRQYPHPCELEAITAAAVSACDGNDGVIDGLLSAPDSCLFDPFSIVENTIDCPAAGRNVTVSEAAATVATAVWSGAKAANGSQLWYGMNRDAQLTGINSIATTLCSATETCRPKPLSLATDTIQWAVKKDSSYELDTMSHEDFEKVFKTAVQQLGPFLASDDPDLSAFRAAGGKILSYHGLADEIIPPNGTRKYYDAVTALDPNIHDFYRLFESPGLGHCYGGSNAYPYSIFRHLVEWVESKQVPEEMSVSFTHANITYNRLLCPYPQHARYRGKGNTTMSSSFYCA